MKVKTIAVIGAAATGRRFAYRAMLGGYETVLEDVSSYVREEAVNWIQHLLGKEAARRKMAIAASDRMLSLLGTSGDVKDAIRGAELIIESVPDELEMKLELFTIFDKFAKTGAIFASTTSSLAIADFSDVTVSQERCIGMRFKYPGLTKNIIELVRTPHTSEKTVEICREAARRMGQEVVLVNEGRNGRRQT